MKNSFETELLHNRRIALLRLIHESNAQKANSSVLHMVMDNLGHTMTSAEVIEDLRFFEHHRLIDLTQATETLYVAHLTGRGEDVIAGRLEVQGIKRPRRGL